jgi:transcriptional regulator with XRE-family HTH domain
MFYFFFHRNQTIKELRKNAGYTAKELALKAKCETVEITRIDNKRLKDIPQKMRDRLLPIFRGDQLDKIPW